ncbi:MAG TPA: hypothetical protein VH120_11010 [Gemmataceae bacterium]|jgi:hypothetical protein|nr:hypothetical protein [Gemmataceae bacterium]
MEIPVSIEPVAGNGYRAKLQLTAEGATRDEALQRLRELLRQPPDGAELSVVENADKPPPHPWAKFAGMYDPEDPLVKEWIEIMAENRRKADEDPNYL